MCVVSLVGEHYSDKFNEYPWLKPYIQPNNPLNPGTGTNPWQQPFTGPVPNVVPMPHIEPIPQKVTDDYIKWLDDYIKHDRPAPTRKEFEDLQKNFDNLKKEVLERAAEYDKRNNEPDCEVEEKVNLLRQVAKLVGVNIEILGTKEK